MQVEYAGIVDLDEHLPIWSQNASRRRDELLKVLDQCVDKLMDAPDEGPAFEKAEAALRAIEKELLDHDYQVMTMGLLMDIRRHTSNLCQS